MSSDNLLYDLSQLKEISGGDSSFIKEILSLFVQSIPGSLRMINTAYQTHDLEGVGREAHKIKPSIDSLGIHDLYNVIRMVEREGKTGDPNGTLGDHIGRLNSVLEVVVNQIAANEL